MSRQFKILLGVIAAGVFATAALASDLQKVAGVKFDGWSWALMEVSKDTTIKVRCQVRERDVGGKKQSFAHCEGQLQ